MGPLTIDLLSTLKDNVVSYFLENANGVTVFEPS